jgi:uncharacterized membrane protein (UPF0127 family)
MRGLLTLGAALLLAGCASKPVTVADLYANDLKLPGGQVIHVQTMVNQWDRLRGLAFQTSLAPDHGMLFLQDAPGRYSYLMYQHFIPLDMIWMDDKQRIVEIVENAQPCKTVASQCPSFGGNQTASFVLKIPAGMTKKYNLRVGDAIRW